jgi:hypothetical protein
VLSTDYFVDLHSRRANRPDHHPRLLLTAIGSGDYDGYLHSWRPGGAAVEKPNTTGTTLRLQPFHR